MLFITTLVSKTSYASRHLNVSMTQTTLIPFGLDILLSYFHHCVITLSSQEPNIVIFIQGKYFLFCSCNFDILIENILENEDTYLHLEYTILGNEES